jgi:hypothetical protein
MIHAALAGKLGCLESEDALTSAIFSRLRYLPPGVLRAWLDGAEHWPPGRNPQTILPWRAGTEPPLVEFWPRWSDVVNGSGSVEPDVVLGFGPAVVIVEAKLWSPKSGAGGERDQIKRQWISACAHLQRHHRSMRVAVHLYITAHLTMPAKDMEESLQALIAAGITSPTLMWLPWSALASTLEAHSGNVVATDLLSYMREVGVLRFRGWSGLVSVSRHPWAYSGRSRRSYWAGLGGQPKQPRWTFRSAARRYWNWPPHQKPAGWRFDGGSNRT